MASVTIKDIPDNLLIRLRERAAADKRSLNKEVIHLLDAALSTSREADVHRYERQAKDHVRLWSALAGRWQSKLTTASEIKAIYARRTKGRAVDL